MDETSVETQSNYIKAQLIHMIYVNETEQFSIAKVRVLETNETYEDDEIVIKGYFGELLDGEEYVFHGEFVHHKKFGLQYEVSHYKRYLPDTEEGLIGYLSSDLFYGIGKRIATRIVDSLGQTAVSKIMKDPTVLDSIKGLTEEKQKQLVQTLNEHQGFDHIVVGLQKYGIGLKLAQKIYKVYQDQALETLESNPYQYVFDIEGFGFHRADLIAVGQGVSLKSSARIQAGILYSLQESMQEGHVYLPMHDLANRLIQLLDGHKHGITGQMIEEEVIKLNEESFVITEEERVYLPVLFFAEAGLSTQVNRLLQHPVEDKVTEADLLKIVGNIEEEESLSYGKEQYDAIKTALEEKVMILTGGPGTGKTTVIKGILKAYSVLMDQSLNLADYDSKNKFPFILTAPTGRAAKRITESTGLPASTIHRLLGWDGHEGFEKNEANQLEGSIIVVDEFSMVDVFLANQLFKAIPDSMQVLLVGDEDQLPSVGPGQVLRDLLESKKVQATQLDEVYRQKEGSKIIHLAHDIKHNRVDETTLLKASDFNFLNREQHELLGTITQIVEKALSKGFELKDVQILAPMYKTDVGIHQLNRQIQSIANPKEKNKRELYMKDVVFRKGDKVIQLVNQPEDGVFNGDIGEITAIFRANENVDEEEQVVVTYEENDVVYNRKDLLNIMHAYCISIHKSQGSEFPIVVMPMTMSYRRMLKKNLLYTAITRAKSSLIICGSMHAFLQGVRAEDTNQRFTTLTDRLIHTVTDSKYADRLEEIVEDEQNLSPFDFMN
ncbi:ATP-dependent DNA helicase, RecD/TraA family [Pelagirhabdus alkalitolerans]|uniref:ATP-dependent RecD2 DNA helicase n=1 Tax=Pelagirhabdus alkalitolerans TaxID=1612202 RepID=A0A1G6HS40_9BACI|nr:ATP-dependent RecD-like DNA helicase [Pelagirhabdus alkalitolerans]SDB97099.1 ATP-dependent DNA helicase, RecD/TraA family [Pelagirhabdus alkalitolerans]